MAEDEEETMRRLVSYRSVFDDFVTRADGRIFNTAGDAVLAEFPSAVDALRAAIDIQESLRTRNLSYPPSRHMVFRIGLTIGDVIERGDDLLGDGVNVAARLQGLAPPGGICVSRSVHEQVADKLSVIFSDLGPQDVKNIPRPVHAYRVELQKEQTSIASPTARSEAALVRPSVLFGIIASLLVAVGALGSILILNKPWSQQEVVKRADVASAVPSQPTATSPVGANSLAVTPSPSAANPPPVPTQNFSDRLTSILEKGVPRESVQSRKNTVTAYSGLPIHRAMAIAPTAKAHWRSGNWPSRQVAEEKVLERCAQFYDEPCAVIATDETLAEPKADGSWTTRDAPKIKYSGPFDPKQIPGLRDQQLQSADISGYAHLIGPKAAAFHAEGLFTVAKGVASQRAAEEKALSDCNAYPEREKSGYRPCYLYAIGNQVVLPLRLISPRTPEDETTQKPVPAAAAVSPVSFESALLAAMADIAPAMPENIRKREGSLYVGSADHKALAMHPPYDSWRRTFLQNEKVAEEVALEGCEVRHGDPCILLAVNDSLQRSMAGEWKKRSMPRVRYDGVYDPEQIPALQASDRSRPDVANYRSKTGPKAAALHPWGSIFVVTHSTSQFAAEVKALSDCNDEPSRNGRDGPCWLYAVGDQVVLPKRSRFPISPRE